MACQQNKFFFGNVIPQKTKGIVIFFIRFYWQALKKDDIKFALRWIYSILSMKK